MPTYFKDIETNVHFVDEAEIKRLDAERGRAHDGIVHVLGEIGEGNSANLSYQCTLKSNPEFTGSVLIACARAAKRLNDEGKVGAYTMLDIPPAYYRTRSRDELLKSFM